MHRAANNFGSAVVELLIRFGADVNAKDEVSTVLVGFRIHNYHHLGRIVNYLPY